MSLEPLIRLKEVAVTERAETKELVIAHSLTPKSTFSVVVLPEQQLIRMETIIMSGETTGLEKVLHPANWYWSRLKEIDAKLREVRSRAEADIVALEVGRDLFEILKYALECGDEKLKKAALKEAGKLMSLMPSEILELKPGKIEELTDGVFIKREGKDLIIYIVTE
ncbi:MAG: hypothetical protein ACTSXC_05270 [Candidatus Freyarchaeota archaeon]